VTGGPGSTTGAATRRCQRPARWLSATPAQAPVLASTTVGAIGCAVAFDRMRRNGAACSRQRRGDPAGLSARGAAARPCCSRRWVARKAEMASAGDNQDEENPAHKQDQSPQRLDQVQR
jgi:hypothetical protein